MPSTAIFHPMLALIALTALVWITMLLRRSAHMKAHGLKPQDLATRVLADERFGAAQLPNNNLMNLFEMPVLFYAGAIVIQALSLTDAWYIRVAWCFVALRAIQSLITITYNNVLHRGLAYLASCCLLWGLWIRLGYQILGMS